MIFPRFRAWIILAAFTANSLGPLPAAQAQPLSVALPAPGQLLSLSQPYTPVGFKGVIIDPQNPFKFDFLVGSGKSGLDAQALKPDSMKLVKYFFAALTVPEEEMWVNLSPYEKDRIITKDFGDTEMGRDLLAQDYILKQVTASLTYPEREMGKKFWDKIYSQAQDKFGTSNIPVNTFNKVWIVPEKATIYEHNNGAFIVESKLKVMLEEDYLSLKAHSEVTVTTGQTVASQIVREIIIPALEREVNEGGHFANLRQIYQAMILATWYKIRLKNSLLSSVYVDQRKTGGVALNDPQANERIYQQYLHAFKKGAYNYIKEDVDPMTQQIVPRKYVSGGMTFNIKQMLKIVVLSAGLSLSSLAASAEPVYNVSVQAASEAPLLDQEAQMQQGDSDRAALASPLLRRLAAIGTLLWGMALPSEGYALSQPQIDDVTSNFAKTIFALSDPRTGIPSSHYGHPGLESVAFTYDVTVEAMILKAAGKQAEAEKIIDYLVQRLRIPMSEIVKNADGNGVYGILRILDKSKNNSPAGLINAFNRSSMQKQGQGQLEYFVTPGPLSFVIMSMLNVNETKYLNDALMLGQTLLAMQRPDGGIIDGNRNPAGVNTEPHMDAMDAFYQLSEVAPQDEKWKKAGDKAWDWFKKNVYKPADGVIHTGIGADGPNTLYATDATSWPLSGKTGERLSLNEVERLIKTMLNKSLVRITFERPDRTKQTVISVDFTDPKDPTIIAARGGFRPMGSSEWKGGVVLAIQKYAARLWQEGDKEKAKYYKAMAEILTDEWYKMGYNVNGLKMFSYATGQDVAVGHGWNTPFFYTKAGVQGGSLIGWWTLLPIQRVNPFSRNDKYGDVYNAIGIGSLERLMAIKEIEKIVADRTFDEPGPAAPAQQPSSAANVVTTNADPNMTQLFRPLENINDPTQALGSPQFKAIVALGKEKLPAIMAFAQDAGQNTNARKWAIRAVGKIADAKDGEVRAFLESILDRRGPYEDWHVKEARQALDDLGPAAAGAKTSEIDQLFEKLRGMTNPIEVLGSEEFKAIVAKGRNAVPEIKKYAADTSKNTDARKWAIRALGRMGRSGDKADIKSFLQDIVSQPPGTYQDWHQKEAGRALEDIDRASISNAPGGIDLNARNLDLQIKRDDKGMPLPIQSQNSDLIKIDRLYPIIMGIAPVKDMPQLLGMR